MNGFSDTHRERFGVEPICRVLQVAPSAYRRAVARRRDPALRCARARRDAVLAGHIERIWQANLQVYGARKVWRQLQREGIEVARCTVERLMRAKGCVVRCEARRSGLLGLIRQPPVRSIASIASSPRSARTSFGSPTSRMSQPGKVSCMSRSLSPSNGSHGSITTGYLSRSGTFRLPRLKRTTIANDRHAANFERSY